uniref:Ciliogenesis-associated TTC17-interacting protein n=1 Tax=Neolamprologus brichardi TaxID=32507 RepID=A0A3Q4HE22_NEOBR
EGGRELGEFSVTVEFAQREQPCMMLHAQSHGAIDDCPCGTAVTAYLTTDLEVLEEDHHEYVKLEGHSVDKRCHMVQRDGLMVIHKVTTVGEEVTEESMSYPMSVLRGLVTEGSSLLLMRLIALRRKMPENMTFVSLDPGLHIINTSFVSLYACLSQRQLEVGAELLDVFGVERIIQSTEGNSSTWQCYFLDDGHLVTRVQVGSPVTMRLLELPSKAEKGYTHPPHTYSHIRGMIPMKDSVIFPVMCNRRLILDFHYSTDHLKLKADHSSYLRQHPEIRALISDFLQLLLLRKPDDVFLFAREYFTPFASNHPADADQEAQSL